MNLFTSLLQFVGVLMFLGMGLGAAFVMFVAFMIKRDEDRGF